MESLDASISSRLDLIDDFQWNEEGEEKKDGQILDDDDDE